MKQLEKRLAKAFEHHRAGRLNEATRIYRAILLGNPLDVRCLHLAGLADFQCGRVDDSIRHLAKAAALKPDFADAHRDLGIVLKTLHRFAEAREHLSRAEELKPDNPQTVNNLGDILRILGDLESARPYLERAIRLKPDYAEAHGNLGVLCLAQGQPEEARLSFEKALALNPGHAGTSNNLGVIHHNAGRREEARRYFERALAAKPDFPDAMNNLAIILLAEDNIDGAIALYRKVLALEPENDTAHSNLGVALLRRGRPDLARPHLERAARGMPDNVERLSNLGVASQEMGRPDEAVDCFRRALAIDTNFSGVHHNLGMALLSTARFAEGWREYEWRWRTDQLAPGRRDFVQPQWQGEDVPGKTLLIHAEQGLGDTLQFCRYASLAAKRGFSVILEVQPSLKRLIRSLPGPDMVLAQGETLPPFDLHCPMMSLPLAFATEPNSIPAPVPYLAPEAKDAAIWADRLSGLQGLKVGLVWAGNPRRHSAQLAAVDKRRSIDPELLLPLSDCPGVNFVSLQKDGPKPPAGLPLADFMDSVEDFADTAALVANLDLVISVDTSVVHLVGALGKPVWVLNRFDSCWRWMREREDSPWYPTLRLFRQQSLGDWTPVVASIAEELQHLSAPTGTLPRDALQSSS